MKTHLRLTVAAVALVTATSIVAAQAPTLRKIYVTAVDDKGVSIPDLAVPDLSVKENGKDRAIVSVAPSTARLRVAIGVIEGLTGDTAVRTAIYDFVKQVRNIADVGIFVIGRRSTPVIDYTADLQAHLTAINGLPFSSATREENFVEGVLEITKNLQRTETGRRVLVGLTVERSQTSSVPADQVFGEFARSGTLFYVATLSGLGGASAPQSAAEELEGSASLRVIGDGTKQTGGRRIDSLRTTGFPLALAQIGDELIHQYEVTYTLPAGVKPSDRVNISAKRKGVTLRAPSRIPDR
jgi:hypothetical protein